MFHFSKGFEQQALGFHNLINDVIYDYLLSFTEFPVKICVTL